MLKPDEFFDLLAGLAECIPLAKTLSTRGLAFAWTTFPQQAREELTSAHLAYACAQRTFDPAPDQKMAVHIQLLTYLYPMRDGVPCLTTGLRHDLPERMNNPSTFHPLVINQAHCAPSLPSAAEPVPQFLTETPEQRRKRIRLLARQTGVKLPKMSGGTAS